MRKAEAMVRKKGLAFISSRVLFTKPTSIPQTPAHSPSTQPPPKNSPKPAAPRKSPASRATPVYRRRLRRTSSSQRTASSGSGRSAQMARLRLL